MLLGNCYKGKLFFFIFFIFFCSPKPRKIKGFEKKDEFFYFFLKPKTIQLRKSNYKREKHLKEIKRGIAK